MLRRGEDWCRRGEARGAGQQSVTCREAVGGTDVSGAAAIQSWGARQTRLPPWLPSLAFAGGGRSPRLSERASRSTCRFSVTHNNSR